MSRGRHRGLGLLAAALFVFLPSSGTSARDQIEVAAAVEVAGWADAVLNHSPGQQDDAATWVAGLTPERRTAWRSGLGMFRDALSGKNVRVSSAAEKRIADVGADIAKTPGLADFIRRALILHGDVAIIALEHPPAPKPLPPVPVSGDVQLLERDGEVVGMALKDWNWAFARSLVEWQGSRVDVPFVSTWFHVTAMFLVSRRQYGEAQNQLNESVRWAPKDPRLLFDRGCLAELQGLPESQSLLSNEDLAALRGQRSRIGFPTLGLARQSTGTAIAGVRPKEVENADAERFFNRALDADPGFIEATVRLARLVDERGWHDEAAELLAKALAGNGSPDPVVRFYAHLIAGRVERERGKLEAAAAHFQAAIALYPDAQSARLGASQVEVLRSDVPAALDVLAPLARHTDDGDLSSDPWWIYGRGLGRYAPRLLRDFWTTERAR